MPSGLKIGAFLIRALGVLVFLVVMLQGGLAAVDMREDGTSVFWALLFLAVVSAVAIAIAYALFAFARSIEHRD